jgi:crotonobetainyl-CoA:carnitine CoA-transferase CaiB-like acyl-CoA transferase
MDGAPQYIPDGGSTRRWISVAVANDAEFRALHSLGTTEVCEDARFATAAARKQHEALLDGELARLMCGRDGAELEEALQAAGVMGCRVAKGWELPHDANLAHIGFFQALTREAIGEHPYKTWPFRFSGIATGHRRPAPLLGQHNREVLGGLLGFDEQALAELEATKVIGTRPVGHE